MELSVFLKKCSSISARQSLERSKFYFVLFDRYNYIECHSNYNQVRDLIHNVMKPDSLYHLKPECMCVHETEHYLTHMDNMSKLKAMGYTKINGF
jgi:hypothetical protein